MFLLITITLVIDFLIIFLIIKNQIKFQIILFFTFFLLIYISNLYLKDNTFFLLNIQQITFLVMSMILPIFANFFSKIVYKILNILKYNNNLINLSKIFSLIIVVFAVIMALKIQFDIFILGFPN